MRGIVKTGAILVLTCGFVAATAGLAEGDVASAAPKLTMGNGSANSIATEGFTRKGRTFVFPEVTIEGDGWLVLHPAAGAFDMMPILGPGAETQLECPTHLRRSVGTELEEHGIGVTAVCPGVINSAIVRTGRMHGETATEEARERGIRAFESRNTTPERVARNALRAVPRNRVVAPISPEAWVFYYLKCAVPGVARAFLGLMACRERAQR